MQPCWSSFAWYVTQTTKQSHTLGPKRDQIGAHISFQWHVPVQLFCNKTPCAVPELVCYKRDVKKFNLQCKGNARGGFSRKCIMYLQMISWWEAVLDIAFKSCSPLYSDKEWLWKTSSPAGLWIPCLGGLRRATSWSHSTGSSIAREKPPCRLGLRKLSPVGKLLEKLPKLAKVLPQYPCRRLRLQIWIVKRGKAGKRRATGEVLLTILENVVAWSCREKTCLSFPWCSAVSYCHQPWCVCSFLLSIFKIKHFRD